MVLSGFLVTHPPLCPLYLVLDQTPHQRRQSTLFDSEVLLAFCCPSLYIRSRPDSGKIGCCGGPGFPSGVRDPRFQGAPGR